MMDTAMRLEASPGRDKGISKHTRKDTTVVIAHRQRATCHSENTIKQKTMAKQPPQMRQANHFADGVPGW